MDLDQFILLPHPREITSLPGEFKLDQGGTIWLDPLLSKGSATLKQRVNNKLSQRLGPNWEIMDTGHYPEKGILFQFADRDQVHPQGYQILIGTNQILINAADAAGAYYASCTLFQIVDQLPADDRVLRGLLIRDWPDFTTRGVMLDISRDKVYTMETLFNLVNELGSWKINQLQLYTEHTFAYPSHPVVWQEASPMTPQEIGQLDVYCRDHFIELVPNQNSFGHMERWLRHKQYEPLAEITEEFVTSWGEIKKGPYSLAPLEPGSIRLIASLYDELLPNFTSSLFNVGCDETFDLGKGRSRETCERLGTARVYLDFLLKIHQLVGQHGKTMQFWGDIILKYPEFLCEIPRDVIGLIWGYEADHPFDHQSELFATTGLRFYVCPGTSTWNSLSGRTDNVLGNLKNAAVNGLRHGAEGYMITDWGDNGHWQMLPVSYLGLASGAAYAWCAASNLDRPVAPWLDKLVFQDQNGMMGRFAYELGNSDHDGIIPLPGNGGYFWPLQWSMEKIKQHRKYQPELFHNGLLRIQQLRAEYLGRDHMMRPDSSLINDEFELTMRMMSHACRRALLALGEDNGKGLREDLAEIIPEYCRIWLARNRVGGLKDSVSRLEKLRQDYD